MGFCARDLGWGGWNHMRGWGQMGGWGGGGWLGALVGLTLLAGLLALLAVGAIWLARRTRARAATAGPAQPQPLDLARRRLASGEITVAEFEGLRERLER